MTFSHDITALADSQLHIYKLLWSSTRECVVCIVSGLFPIGIGEWVCLAPMLVSARENIILVFVQDCLASTLVIKYII